MSLGPAHNAPRHAGKHEKVDRGQRVPVKAAPERTGKVVGGLHERARTALFADTEAEPGAARHFHLRAQKQPVRAIILDTSKIDA